MGELDNGMGVIASTRLGRSDAAAVLFLLNGVKQVEQDFLAPVEQDSLVPVARFVPVEAAEGLPAGLV
jgi:hypothetical protein